MSDGYLLAGRESELRRLTVQSVAWEPAARQLLATLGSGEGWRAVDIGCAAHGWLRVLSAWVGVAGEVVGTDVDRGLLAAADELIRRDGLGNVAVVEDDLFASTLAPRSFDLVHARFVVAPLGRCGEQVAAYMALLKPGGLLVLEDPDTSTWDFDPPAPAAEALIARICEVFLAAGGNLDQGPANAALLRDAGLEPEVARHVLELAPDHPYLRAPLHFAESLRGRLEALAGAEEIARLVTDAEREVDDPSRRGRAFALVQTWARVP